jgi:hypothetical protein
MGARRLRMAMAIAISALLLPSFGFGQSDLETAIRGGELILTGLTALKSAKADPYAKVLPEVCVKNKMDRKVTYVLDVKAADETESPRELVIQKDGKECFFDLPKGVYRYQIKVEGDSVFKKGECRIDREQTIILKAD